MVKACLQYYPVNKKNDAAFFCCTATGIGEFAFEKVSEKGQRGIVHDVFNRAVNIILSDGSLLSILDDQFLTIPFGVSVVLDSSYSFRGKIHAGDFVCIDNNKLLVKSAGFQTEVLLPREICFTKNQIFSFQAIKKPFISLIPDWVKMRGKKGGFFALYRSLGFTQGNYAEEVNDAICDYAADRINNLSSFLVINDLSNSVENLLQLVGLGNGLTPSGDDFILGFLAFLNSVSEPIFPEKFMENVRREMSGAIRNRTTTVSEAYLISALDGQFSEKLTTFVAGFFTNDSEEMKKFANNLIDVGSSSGIDMILGCLFAIRLYQTKLTKNT